MRGHHRKYSKTAQSGRSKCSARRAPSNAYIHSGCRGIVFTLGIAFRILDSMWNVNDRFEARLLEALPAAGFIVSSTGGVTRVEKYGSGAEFRRTADDHYLMTILPTILMNGQFTRLWDAGYQKFLLTDDGRKFPATADQLLRMRRFNEELRTALGVPTYYNEALGSTSQVSVYDRVKGRVGDDPGRTVGVKPVTGH